MKYLKKILIAILIACVYHSFAATTNEQIADTLYWNGNKYAVQIAWEVPSVLECYYWQSEKSSPFTTWKTNLTRGHIAYFRIDNPNSDTLWLYLDSVEAKNFKTRRGNLWTEGGIDTTAVPDYFKIEVPEQFQLESSMASHWFSGILRLELVANGKVKKSSNAELNGTWYIVVENGKVVEYTFVGEDDLKRIKKSNNKQDSKLDNIKKAINRYNNYYSYYVRALMDNEEVVWNGHRGRFEKGNLPMVMSLYGNNPITTRYNWVSDTCGAPFGKWSIRNDTIFLDEIWIHTGSDYHSYGKFQYIPTDTTSQKIPTMAHWLNGEFSILYGSTDTNEYGVQSFTVKKTQKIKVRQGIVYAIEWSPRSFEEDAISEEIKVCDENNIYSVKDAQLEEAVGKYKTPKTVPTYEGGMKGLGSYLTRQKIADERMKGRIFRVKIGFIVSCDGEVSGWQVVSKGKGELFEFANIVMERLKMTPNKWQAAKDKKGNAVDCWQYVVFTVNDGRITNYSYSEK